MNKWENNMIWLMYSCFDSQIPAFAGMISKIPAFAGMIRIPAFAGIISKIPAFAGIVSTKNNNSIT
jgi:hypothetical protein